MLRQAINSAAPTDATLLNLCCTSQQPAAFQPSELVILADKALEVRRLLLYGLEARHAVLYPETDLNDHTDLVSSGGSGAHSKSFRAGVLGQQVVYVQCACVFCRSIR